MEDGISSPQSAAAGAGSPEGKAVSSRRTPKRRVAQLHANLVSPARIGDNQRMSSAARVTIHPSQFPEAIRRDLLESLRTRRVNHKFHYDSAKQTQKWLALHQAHSPSRNDADCAATYDAAFVGASEQIQSKEVHLIGLGCGGGQKDTRLLKLLHTRGVQVSYTPSDVSTAMVLVAREAALAVVRDEDCFPLVCDLATASDLAEVFVTHHASRITRLLTFFGMIPNFEPADVLPKLAALVRPDDWLLFSANLAPGPDYAAGVQRVLPQYDNPLTRDWLLTFPLDLGVERGDGEMRFTVEEDNGLKRIVARFCFTRPRRIELESDAFEFAPGESLQLFFSYRYTPALIQQRLQTHGILVERAWLTKSEEEGVWLCRRQ
jgi:uncharacterized SAM-dependent methyltransferase